VEAQVKNGFVILNKASLFSPDNVKITEFSYKDYDFRKVFVVEK